MNTWTFEIDTTTESLAADQCYKGNVSCRPLSIEEKLDLMVSQALQLNEKNEFVSRGEVHPLVHLKNAISLVDNHLEKIELHRVSDSLLLDDTAKLKFVTGNDHVYMAVYAFLLRGPSLGNF